MNIVTSIKPHRYTSNCKKNIVSSITTGYNIVIGSININSICISYNAYKRGFQTSDNDIFRVFNLVKHNRKSIRDNKGKTIKIIPMYWEAYVYDIPMSLLKATGLSIRQNSRNFTLYKDKR